MVLNVPTFGMEQSKFKRQRRKKRVARTVSISITDLKAFSDMAEIEARKLPAAPV